MNKRPEDETAAAPARRLLLDRALLPTGLARAASWSLAILVIVAAAAAAVFALVELRLIVIPVIVALFLSAFLAPPAEALRQRGWPSLLATWAVLLAFAALLAGVVAFVAPAFVRELGDVGEALEKARNDFETWLSEGPLDLSQAEVSDYIRRAQESLASNRDAITGGVIAGALKAVEIVAGFFLVIILVFFFVKDGKRMFDWLLEQLPERTRRKADGAARVAWKSVGGYIRGVAVIALVDAILIGIALKVIGVPLVLPLAVLTFFGAFIPLLGALAAGLVAAVVALVLEGFTAALLVTAAIIVIQEIEGDVLQPIVMARSVKLHPVVIVLSLTAGGILGGLVGAFLGVPIAAVTASVVGYLRFGEDPSAPVEVEAPA